MADVAIVEALRQSIRERRPVPLTYAGRPKQPTPEQEIHKRPVREPQTVNVRSPSGD